MHACRGSNGSSGKSAAPSCAPAASRPEPATTAGGSNGERAASATSLPSAAASTSQPTCLANIGNALPPQEAKAQFLKRWGRAYGYGGRIDELYEKEIGSRLPAGQHYLDYTGSALYCRTPLRTALDDLQARRHGRTS
jgi:hypothetical protein